MNKRAIVLVIDGLGIGAMDDAWKYCQVDQKANTLKSLLNIISWKDLPNLQKLGLEKVFKNKLDNQPGIFGKAKLNYPGADSYLGHKEINGSIISKIDIVPFKNYLKKIEQKLLENNLQVKIKKYNNASIIIVNDAVIIADNIENNLGQIINISACFDFIEYEVVLKIGQIVRDNVNVSRVIALGAHKITMTHYLKFIQEPQINYIGINTPLTGVYNSSYMCKHFGLVLDSKVELPTILATKNINSYLVGKYGDLIFNPEKNNSYNISNTNAIFKKTFELLDNTKTQKCFIGINIQETDLAGHAMDVQKFASVLVKIDQFIGQIIQKLSASDILIVCADHGNDPQIGHSHHTREFVPILIYNNQLKEEKKLNDIDSLNSIAQTAANWLGLKTSHGKNLL